MRSPSTTIGFVLDWFRFATGTIRRVGVIVYSVSTAVCSSQLRADTIVPGQPYPKSYDSLMGSLAIIQKEYKDAELLFFYKEPRTTGTGGTVLGIIQLDRSGTYALLACGAGENMEYSFSINKRQARATERLLFRYEVNSNGPEKPPEIVITNSPVYYTFSLKNGDECEFRIGEEKRGGEPLDSVKAPPATGEIDGNFRQTIVVGRKSNSQWHSRIFVDKPGTMKDP